jgi:hypothetical protein
MGLSFSEALAGRGIKRSVVLSMPNAMNNAVLVITDVSTCSTALAAATGSWSWPRHFPWLICALEWGLRSVQYPGCRYALARILRYRLGALPRPYWRIEPYRLNGGTQQGGSAHQVVDRVMTHRNGDQEGTP